MTSCVLSLWGFAALPQAVQGADDSDLRAAALTWLHAEDSTDALVALATMAAEGNSAARALVNTIDRRFGHIDFPDMSREERRALLLADQGQPASSFSVYRDTATLDLLGEAHQRMTDATTPEEWISGAQMLLDAGLTEPLIDQMRGLSGFDSSRPEIDIQAMKFIESQLGDDPTIRSQMWFVRLIDQAMIDWPHLNDPEKRNALIAGWEGTPWTAQERDSFLLALADGEWAALRGASVMFSFAQDATQELLPPPDQDLQRFIDMVRSAFWGGSRAELVISDADLDALGSFIVEDAGRSYDLRPILNSCAMHCADSVNICLAAGALGLLDQLVRNQGRWEPVITLEEYASSARAARELTYRYGERLANDAWPETISMPQCYKDAALALVNPQ